MFEKNCENVRIWSCGTLLMVLIIILTTLMSKEINNTICDNESVVKSTTLQKPVKDNTTNIISNEYYGKIFITSIGERVDLGTKFYIERKFLNSSENFPGELHLKFLNFNELTNVTLLLLSDDAGSGKTTTFRHIAQKFKEIFKLHWVSFVDLKQFVHVLPEFSQTSKNVSQLADFLLYRFFNMTDKLTSKIFKNSFRTNKLIFLWDGVDEISPAYLNETISIIQHISKLTESRQWISTRSAFKQEIEEILNIQSYKLKSFDDDDREKFIESFMKSENVSVSKAEYLKQEILKFLKSLENYGPYSNKKIVNPRFLQMICKYSIDNPLKLYPFYKFYISTLMDIADEKGEVVRSRIKKIREQEIFRQIHQHFALLSYFDACSSLDINKVTANFNKKDISRYGILVQNQYSKLNFEHETFADFFVAQYFFQNVWKWQYENPRDEEAQTRLELLFNLIRNVNGNYKITLDFLIGFIEHEFKISNQFNQFIERIVKHRYKNFLQTLGQDLNGINFVTKFFRKDLSISNTLWRIDQNCTFFMHFFLEISHSDCCSLQGSKYKTLKKFKTIIEENFDEKKSRKIFQGNFQTVNKLFIIWMNINQEDFVNEFVILTNLHTSYVELHKVENFSSFLNFIESKKFSNDEIREFLRSNFNSFQSNTRCFGINKTIWHFPEKYFSVEEIEQMLGVNYKHGIK